jgi:predicted AAA+ superfamily ATPase
LRVLIDRHRRAGRFLLLGSASPALLRQASETLAGRIRYLELAPFTLAEITAGQLGDQDRLWLRGGFPNAFLASSAEGAADWLEAFVDSFLTRDLPGLGSRVAAAQLRRFLTMIAHCHGQLWNGLPIATSLGVSAPTVRHYLDLLTDTFMARPLPPWTENVKKRLIKSPKVYLRDSGILHRMLNIDDRAALLGHPVAGASWEGFIIEQIIRQAPSRAQFYFYRTAAGAEIDLVMFLPGQARPIAIEVKLSSAPKPERGFWLACEDLSVSRGYVVYPGHDRYLLKPGFEVLPAAQLADIVK